VRAIAVSLELEHAQSGVLRHGLEFAFLDKREFHRQQLLPAQTVVVPEELEELQAGDQRVSNPVQSRKRRACRPARHVRSDKDTPLLNAADLGLRTVRVTSGIVLSCSA